MVSDSILASAAVVVVLPRTGTIPGVPGLLSPSPAGAALMRGWGQVEGLEQQQQAPVSLYCGGGRAL